MGNYLKMTDQRRVLALLELGWSYRRIQRETGVRRETIARYDPRRQAKAANVSTGAEASPQDVAVGEGVPKAANLSADSTEAHGPPGLAAPYREQINAGLQQGLTAQRIWQDLCADPAVCYPHSYASVRRYVRRLKQARTTAALRLSWRTTFGTPFSRTNACSWARRNPSRSWVHSGSS